MVKAPPELENAFRESGLTINELIAKARIETTESSMSRKLRGEQGIDPKDLAKVARALGYDVAWTGSAFRLQKAA